MTIRAILFEYKQDGCPGAAGPGDALRLTHALRHPDNAGVPIKLLTTVPSFRLSGFFANAELTEIPPTDNSVVDAINDEDLATRLESWLGDDLCDAKIIHVFIGEACDPFPVVQLTSPAGYRFTRQRIDRSKPGGVLLYSRWNGPIAPLKEDRWLGAAVRKLKSNDCHNSPTWFPELVRRVAKKEGYRIAWFGDFKDSDAQQDEQVLKHDGLSFMQQIDRFRDQISCAVGWNSGGLDLAAAAGVPVLRVGEFQGSAVPEDDGCQPEPAWGKSYNWFLSVATTIGLAPRVRRAEKFNQQLLADSLRSFLRNHQHFLQPRHIILACGVHLAINESDLLLQLEATASSTGKT